MKQGIALVKDRVLFEFEVPLNELTIRQVIDDIADPLSVTLFKTH